MIDFPDCWFLRNRFASRVLIFILLLLFCNMLSAQVQTVQNDSINKSRLNTVIISSSAFYAATLGVLYFGWYKDNPSSSFHFFDDSQNWLQLDKVGHATTAYTFSNYSYWMLRWAGVNNTKSALYSGLMGFGSMTVIEILDGFSAEYGASGSDLLANALGASLSVSQNLFWKEQRISLKFSYYPSEYAQYYPAQLGDGQLQRIIKDYNAQTYWLSASIGSFLKKESKFPKWINIAFGYGAGGMLAPLGNPEFDPEGNQLPQFDRVRQYFFSMDIDLTKIKTNSKGLRTVFKTLSFIKIPFPTLEYNSSGQFVWYLIY
ncbi:MAG TPA: DUF2279 domain-containing protein [Bacteroidales bacterium]